MGQSMGRKNKEIYQKIMERDFSQKLSEVYKDTLRASPNPAFTTVAAIEGITKCPNEKQEILNVFGEKIRIFGLKDLGTMQKVITDLEQTLLQKLKVSGFFKRRRINKQLSSCQDVAIFLATTALEIQNSTPR
jgi:hypothetical protein